MKSQKTLLIRADADIKIGSGHVMRCLALAEAWQECGGYVIFVLATSTPLLEERLHSESMMIQHLICEPGSSNDACETIQIAQDHEVKWIVVDGYNFGAEYQKIIKDSGFSLLFIDDYGHADHYYADIVLNQNFYADMTIYKKYEPNTRFFLGAKFVLLRREFLKWGMNNRIIPEVAHKILITFGGADRENITQSMIEALKRIQISGLEVIVVVGGINQNFNTLQQSVKDNSGFSIRKNVNDMSELMAWADIAISAGGTTCWELSYMGLPAILYPVVENQKPIVWELCLKGIVKCFKDEDISNLDNCINIIKNLLISHQDRCELHKNMKKLVDGEGAHRVIKHLSLHQIRLRQVRKNDCELIYSWINDSFVRSNSFNLKQISLEEHINWFNSVISDPDTCYYIALDNLENPLGQARFRLENNEAVISVLLGKDHRGKGLGSELIKCATKRCFTDTGINKINAYIKIKNIASLKAFLKAGYNQMEITTEDGQTRYHLLKWRDEK